MFGESCFCLGKTGGGVAARGRWRETGGLCRQSAASQAPRGAVDPLLGASSASRGSVCISKPRPLPSPGNLGWAQKMVVAWGARYADGRKDKTATKSLRRSLPVFSRFVQLLPPGLADRLGAETRIKARVFTCALQLVVKGDSCPPPPVPGPSPGSTSPGRPRSGASCPPNRPARCPRPTPPRPRTATIP